MATVRKYGEQPPNHERHGTPSLGIGVRIKEHDGKRAILCDQRQLDGTARVFAQVRYGEWVEMPEGGIIPAEAWS